MARQHIRKILNFYKSGRTKYVYKEIGKAIKKAAKPKAKPTAQSVTNLVKDEKRLARLAQRKARRAAKKGVGKPEDAGRIVPVKPKPVKIIPPAEVAKAKVRFDNIINKAFAKKPHTQIELRQAHNKTNVAIDRRTEAMNKPEKLIAWARKLESENYHSVAQRAFDKARLLGGGFLKGGF